MPTSWETALYLIEEERYAEAVPLLEEIRRGMESGTELEVLEKLAICQTHLGDLEQAEELLLPVSELATLRQDHAQLTRTRLSLSFVAVARREYQIALYHVCRAYDAYEKLTDKPEELYVKLLLQTATVSYYRGRPDLTAETLTDVLRHYQHLLSSTAIEKASMQWINEHHRMNNSIPDLHSTEQVQAMIDHILPPDIVDRVQCRLTALHANDENWQESVQKLLQYITQYAHQGETVYEGETHAELAEILIRYQQEELAVLHATRALELLPELYPASGKAHHILAISLLNENQATWQEHVQKASDVYLQLGLFGELNAVVESVSQHFVEHKQWEGAFRLLDEWKNTFLHNLQERGIAL